MAYSNLSYKIANSSKYVDAIGEYTLDGVNYILVEKATIDNDYTVYILNYDGELERMDPDSDISDEVIDKWNRAVSGDSDDEPMEMLYYESDEELDY